MAVSLPTIEVTDTQVYDVRPPGTLADYTGERSVEDGPPGRRPSQPGADGVSHPASSMSAPDLRPDPASTGKTNAMSPSDGGLPSQTPTQTRTTIDPLSHHILKRTQTENTIPQKLRAGANGATSREGGTAGGVPPSEGIPPGGRKSTDKARGEESSGAKEKKKGVSFLSRIIGTKKKDAAVDSIDNESEAGERRAEGLDAPVFSQPITSNGFIPHHPPPPNYIKVRTHDKKSPDFNRVFLAQELHRRGPEQNGRSARTGISADAGRPGLAASATWALEFSMDGRFLAAGGQDRVVRVWAVISTSEEREAHENEEDGTSVNSTGQAMRLNAPVFKTKPIREYEGHTSDVLDLSWSKNNFLLSSSMDKTVRLWHVSRTECLCCFKHSDFVTSISFHPRDDRFFLAGSLDSKLRLWSIPDKSVAYWNHLPDLITAVAFTPDGKMSIAGCLNGLCLFYETEGLRYNTQIHVRSSHGRNAKGSKITGIQTIHYPPNDPNAEVKLLVTSNDSRVRLYNFRDKSLEMKFRGNENTCSQIHASFSDDARYVVCGSEDRKVYIWSTGPAEGEKKDKRPVEMFTAHPAIVTTTVLAPVTTRQMLGRSGDPIYDLCNPPPVTLVSRTESRGSSRPPTASERRSHDPNASGATTLVDARLKSATPAEESPSYIARSAHPNGNIIVSADYMGTIKVFRQDCAYARRRNEAWDTSSTFSKKIGSGILNRSASIAARNGTRERRASTSSHPPSDRIISWRNGISSNTSLENAHRHSDHNRSISPRKFTFSRSGPRGSTPLTSHTAPSVSTASPPDSVHERYHENNNNTGAPTLPPGVNKTLPSKLGKASVEAGGREASRVDADADADADPMMVQPGGESLAFYNVSNWTKAGDGGGGGSRGGGAARHSLPPMHTVVTHDTTATTTTASRRSSAAVTAVSALSSELDDERAAAAAAAAGHDNDDVPSEGSESEQTLRCRLCGSGSFKARKFRTAGGGGGGGGGGVGAATTSEGPVSSSRVVVAQRLICTKCGTAV